LETLDPLLINENKIYTFIDGNYEFPIIS